MYPAIKKIMRLPTGFYPAILAMLPLSLAVIPWGILCGTIAIAVGMNPWQAQAMSLFVFAGAVQISSMAFMASGIGFLSILTSSFVISSRHLLYSMTLRQAVLYLPLRWRLLLAFLLTDEMFVVSRQQQSESGQFSVRHALIAGFFFYLVWNMSTLLGIIAGSYIDNLETLGLDFAIVATFVAMSASQLRQMPMLLCAVVSGISAVYLQSLLPNAYIVIAALLGMFAGYFASTGKH